MKKLITEKIMEGFVASHGQGAEFPIDDNTLITPSAKDVARSNKIKFVEKCDACVETQEEKKEPCCESKPAETKPAESCAMTYDRQMIVEAVMKVLQEKGILDKILDK